MAFKKTDISKGDKFGRWTVMTPDQKNQETGGRHHSCKCDCGTIRSIYHGNLVSGKTKSCGCMAREMTGNRSRTHGMSGSKIYMTWNRMLSRCSNPIVDRYEQYGGRGIAVCDRWKKFENFYADMGDIPGDGYSIGRKDNDGNYEPGNCRWETALEQGNNTSTNVFIEFNGKRKTLSQWVRIYNLDYSRTRQRFAKGIEPPELFDPKHRIKRLITIGTKTMLVTEWMKELDIPISTYYLKKRRGKTDVEIISGYLDKKPHP